MKIALFNTMTPFVKGGAEGLVEDLSNQLEIRGHKVTIFRIPFPNDYETKLIELVLATKMLNFSEYDRVICFKYPTFSIIHRNKVLWICHQFRQVYDLWNKEFGLPDNKHNQALKQIITSIDTKDIGEARHIYTIARVVSKRMKKFNNIESEFINPPLISNSQFFKGDIGDYLFYPSRVTELKRQLLAIEAMKYTKSKVKIVIAGYCENEEYLNRILETIKRNNLDSKVKFINNWISEDEKIKFMANSLGCIFIPYNEDYGYITLEAFYSSKLVITCNDSGGPCDFVQDGRTGYIVEPTAEELAVAMDSLYDNKEKAELMGDRAYEEIIARNITWDETIRRLLL